MKNKGFTLIELLVVIAIIGILSSVVLASLNSARKRARDTRRLSDMNQIQTALEYYYDNHGRYPQSDYDGCGGWDVGNQDFSLIKDGLGEVMPKLPVDSIATGNCSGYRYYRYSAGSYGCDSSRGAFYVLGVTDMESSNRPYPTSLGWSCPNRDWQNEFDWVTGKFEK